MDSTTIKPLIELTLQPYKDKIAELEKIIAEQKKLIKPSYMSADIKDLATALSKAQAEMNIAELNRSNPFFKSTYADITSIVKASRPALTKFGLSVPQDIVTYDDGNTFLITVLLHSSGQYIESRIKVVPPKNDIQSIRSHITYLKRTAYEALIGVVTGDEDDDGELAMDRGSSEASMLSTPADPNAMTISSDELRVLEKRLNNYPQIAAKILKGFGIEYLSQIKKIKYDATLAKVEELITLENSMKR